MMLKIFHFFNDVFRKNRKKFVTPCITIFEEEASDDKNDITFFMRNKFPNTALSF